MTSAGGWKAIAYTLETANRVGWMSLWKAMRSKNACKTCALGMGGQAGGMVNEAGHFPEVCKKSLQAMVADMQGGHRAEFFSTLLDRPAASLLAARAGSLRPADAARSYAGAGESYYRPIAWDDAWPRIVDAAEGDRARRALLVLQRSLARTKPASCCSCSPGSTAPTTSTTAATTATRPAASDWRRAWAPARPRSRSTTSEHADLVFVIGGNPAPATIRG